MINITLPVERGKHIGRFLIDRSLILVNSPGSIPHLLIINITDWFCIFRVIQIAGGIKINGINFMGNFRNFHPVFCSGIIWRCPCQICNFKRSCLFLCFLCRFFFHIRRPVPSAAGCGAAQQNTGRQDKYLISKYGNLHIFFHKCVPPDKIILRSPESKTKT